MIDGIGRNQPPRNFPSAPVAAASPPVTDGRAKPASAQLSGVARELAVAPPVDAARVAALRTAIADGSYKVDPDAIAARLIAFDSGSNAG